MFVVSGTTTVVAISLALKLSFCTISAGRRPSVILPNASPKSTHHISPRVIFHRLPHCAHRSVRGVELFFARNRRVHGIYARNFRFVDGRICLQCPLFYQQALHFFKNPLKRRNIEFFQFRAEIRIRKITHIVTPLIAFLPHYARNHALFGSFCSDKSAFKKSLSFVARSTSEFLPAA